MAAEGLQVGDQLLGLQAAKPQPLSSLQQHSSTQAGRERCEGEEIVGPACGKGFLLRGSVMADNPIRIMQYAQQWAQAMQANRCSSVSGVCGLQVAQSIQ